MCPQLLFEATQDVMTNLKAAGATLTLDVFEAKIRPLFLGKILIFVAPNASLIKIYFRKF